MRLYFISSFILPLFLASCAYEGVIVQKNSGPLPFYESIGVDGSYKLALRDSSGMVRSQLVTPEVFEGYTEGQYFNDLQPGPGESGASAAAKGMASNTTGTGGGHAIGVGRGAIGTRVAVRTTGTHRAAMIAKAPQARAQHYVASTRKFSPPITRVASKIQSPAVTAHFSVAVQGPALVKPTAPAASNASSNPQTSSTAYVVASKAATVTHSAAKKLPAKKSVKPTAIHPTKAKAVDPSRSAHAARSAQIPLVR